MTPFQWFGLYCLVFVVAAGLIVLLVAVAGGRNGIVPEEDVAKPPFCVRKELPPDYFKGSDIEMRLRRPPITRNDLDFARAGKATIRVNREDAISVRVSTATKS